MIKKMMRSMLKSKIHRATVTDANLAYEGSITIDQVLMKKANLYPHEEVSIYNITNGERFSTYVIAGPHGNGDICINGAAAHKGKKGDKIIIVSYVGLEEEEARVHRGITQQHNQGGRQHRGGHERDDGGDEQRPDGQRQPEERHPGRAEVDDRGDIVDRTHDR